MNNLLLLRFMGILAALGLAACSTSHTALKGEADDLYFMSSDVKVATEFAVQNNNRENFKNLEQTNVDEYIPENFSAKNVNPEYLAKYQSDNLSSSDDGTVYFDESDAVPSTSTDGDINIYNNFRGNSGYNNFNSGYNNFNSWGMNPWSMSSMYMGGFSPWGMGGMGGLYDPFWGSGFGFRPGFNLSLGLGFGFGSRLGLGFGNPWRHGFGMGYYDPFYSPYYGYGRPIIIVPGGTENRRQIVRGARPSRGTVATGARTRDNLASPSDRRASARREAVSRTSTPATRANSRTDFSRSQNDYYNARTRNASAASAAPTRRNMSSPTNRTGNASSRENHVAPSRTIRTQAPSINRGSSTESRSRYAAPSRSSSPSYNRSSSPQNNRSVTPSKSRSNYSTPSRSSSPSYSAPSRSSGSSGGAVRSSGGSSRRGN